MRRAVAGKARVHELAKELGISSKQVLSKLQDLGEYVKSPSSTVEAPVARRLRESVSGGDSGGGARPGRRPGGGRPPPRGPVAPVRHARARTVRRPVAARRPPSGGGGRSGSAPDLGARRAAGRARGPPRAVGPAPGDARGPGRPGGRGAVGGPDVPARDRQ